MSPPRFNRRSPHRETRKLFVIATEGQETERIYFAIFNGEEYRKNVRVHVLPTRKGASSPQSVLKRLRTYAHEIGIDPGDELWVVVDVDRWGEATLDALCHACHQADYNVAVSNPCFELWLVLHQEKPRTPISAKACEREMELLLGRPYDKADYATRHLIPHIEMAIKHARRLDRQPDDQWPRETGTHVYKLVTKLIQK